MSFQALSLVASVVFFIFSIYLVFISKPDVKWIYVTFAFGWLAGIVFYVRYIYFGGGSHDLSSMLRLFQNMTFGIWLIIISFEKLFEGSPTLKNDIEEKVVKWLNLQKS